jgi:hypothetical protein
MVTLFTVQALYIKNEKTRTRNKYWDLFIAYTILLES